MAIIFHTSEGFAWESYQELEKEDLNVLITSVIQENLPPEVWFEYIKYSRSSLLEVFAYLLSLAGPSDPTEAELVHMRACFQKALKDDVKTLDIPDFDTFRNTVKNFALRVPDDAGPWNTSMTLTAEATTIGKLKISGDLTRPRLTDIRVADRTMLVSLSDEGWIDEEKNWTTHLHLSRTFGYRASNSKLMKVKFFRGVRPITPSIAITFVSTEQRNNAIQAFASFNIREGAERLRVRKSEYSEDANTIWSLSVGETDFHKVRDLVLGLLPHGTYVPSYVLTEETIGSCGILKLNLMVV
ncbi:MAG: hypothetical protein Q9221_003258 [Calogaya cf. arnoldii]